MRTRISFLQMKPPAEVVMEHKETGCKAPEGPRLCINNCGFFGSAATMNLCSKCHKELILKQQQADLAASSIDNILNGGGGSSGKDAIISTNVVTTDALVQPKIEDLQSKDSDCSNEPGKLKAKDVAPVNRCSTCRKRVGLMGFSCRCGNLFCAAHRYSDKHGCPFDYQKAARDAIAKANPVVKAEKLDKI